MIKTFFKNSFIYTIGNILTRGISIILLPIYTRYLTPAQYGIIDLFSIIASIISLTVALEISQAIARYYQDVETRYEKTAYTSTAFLFTIFMYLLYIIVSLTFADQLTVWILDDINKKNIFLLATFAISTSGVFYFTQNQLKWQIQPKDSVIVSIVNMLVMAIVTLYFLLFKHYQVESIFIGQIVGNILAIFIGIYYAKESYKIIFIYKYLKNMLHYSFPLIFSSISVFISLYIDRIMIKEFLDFNELGIYGIAYRFASVVGIIMIGFQQSLTPLIFKHYKEKDTPQKISQIFNIFIIFSLIIYLGSILFSKEVVELLTTPEYYKSSDIIPFLVLVILLSNMYIFFPGLSIVNKTKLLAILNLFGAIINTILNYYLVQIYGLLGIVYATLMGAFLVLVARVFLSNKYYPLPYVWKKIIIVFISITLIGYFTNRYICELSFFYILSLKFCIILIALYLISIVFFKDKINKKVFNVWNKWNNK